MIIQDDTPEPSVTPPVYPCCPPCNLLGTTEELFPRNFFAFEGIDGAGKTTLIDEVTHQLSMSGRGVTVIALKSVGVVTHALERAKWLNADPLSINLLNWVALVENTLSIRSLLNRRDHIVIADRYTLTVKVRGMLEGLDPAHSACLETYVPSPQEIFLIDAAPEECVRRIATGGRRISYFEAGFRDVDALGSPMIEHAHSERVTAVNRTAALGLHLNRSRELFLRLSKNDARVSLVANSSCARETAASIANSILGQQA